MVTRPIGPSLAPLGRRIAGPNRPVIWRARPIPRTTRRPTESIFDFPWPFFSCPCLCGDGCGASRSGGCSMPWPAVSTRGRPLRQRKQLMPNHANRRDRRSRGGSRFPPSRVGRRARPKRGRDWFSRVLSIQLDSCRPGTPRPRTRPRPRFRRRRRPRWAPPDLW